MSSSHNILRMVEQAVQEYINSNTSNTIHGVQDVDYDLQPYCMMTKTGYMEFDPMSARAKLPAGLTRSIGPFICNYVILQDPKRNNIQVSIEKRNNKIYFAQGWTRLRDFYGLTAGGWVTILYISPLLFYIRVRKVTELEVSYPERTPPYNLLLLEGSGEHSSNGPVPYFTAPTIFFHKLEKTLTSHDVESRVLRLFWRGFCENALPKEDTELTIMDWLGCSWKCNLHIEGHPQKTCQIYGQWSAICNTHRLIEGVTLRLIIR